MCVCARALSRFSRVRFFETSWTVAHHFLCPWDSPGQNTGVGCHALLQGIFPTQGLKPALAGGFFTSSTTWEASLSLHTYICCCSCSVAQSCLALCNPTDCLTIHLYIYTHTHTYKQITNIHMMFCSFSKGVFSMWRISSYPQDNLGVDSVTHLQLTGLESGPAG